MFKFFPGLSKGFNGLSFRLKSLIILSLAFFWACSDDSPEPGNLANLRPLTGEETYLIDVSNRQAFSILNQIDKIQSTGNFAVSPISSGMAIGMLYNGASEETKLTLHQKLDLTQLDEIMINKTFYGLGHFLKQVDYRQELTLSNSIWFNYQSPLNELYRNKMMAYYQADVEPVDLDKTPVKMINKLISNRTDGHIDQLFDDLETSKSLILVNALHFDGKPDLNLRHIKFQSRNKSLSDSVEMLVDENAIFNLYESNGFRLIDFPYQNKQFRLSLLQPTTNLRDWIKNLNIDQYQSWLKLSDTIKNRLILPQITFENSIQIDPVILEPQASFPHIFGNQPGLNPDRPDLFQKNLLAINSESQMQITGSEFFTPMDSDIVLDSPFVFVLREIHTGIILMCGIYNFE